MRLTHIKELNLSLWRDMTIQHLEPALIQEGYSISLGRCHSWLTGTYLAQSHKSSCSPSFSVSHCSAYNARAQKANERTWKVAGVRSRIHVPASWDVMLDSSLSPCKAGEPDRKEISEPWECVELAISSGANVTLPQTSSPP